MKCFGNRKRQLKCCPLTFFTTYLHFSLMKLSVLFYKRKTNTNTSGIFLFLKIALIETIEDMRNICCWYSNSRIPNTNDNMLLKGIQLSFYSDQSSFVIEFYGVVQKIINDFFKLIFVYRNPNSIELNILIFNFYFLTIKQRI